MDCSHLPPMLQSQPAMPQSQTALLQDYLRNVAKIRREFADVLTDDGERGGRLGGRGQGL